MRTPICENFQAGQGTVHKQAAGAGAHCKPGEEEDRMSGAKFKVFGAKFRVLGAKLTVFGALLEILGAK